MANPEAIIEDYLVREVRKLGGVAEKFVSPSKRAVPDRICQFDYDLIVFVELKAKGLKPSPAQAEDHKRRRARGHTVMVLDSKESVDKFIYEIKEILQLREQTEGIL
jgi:hypothetical protein